MRQDHSSKTNKGANPAESNNNILPQMPPKQEKALPKEGDIRKVQEEEVTSYTENEQSETENRTGEIF